MRSCIDLARRVAFWCGAAAIAATVPAHAQVIEIGDDGAATTYATPTRFISDDMPRSLASAVTVRPVEVDRYERVANAEGLDVHLLRAVAWTESRGHENATSPKGALGVMQLMPSTAAEMGIDPRNPDENLNGGARYLARQLSRFQSVPLALAAYNAGPNAVLRWGGIPPYAETQAYVAQILSRYRGTPAPPMAPRVAPPPIARRVNPMLIEVPSL